MGFEAPWRGRRHKYTRLVKRLGQWGMLQVIRTMAWRNTRAALLLCLPCWPCGVATSTALLGRPATSAAACCTSHIALAML